MTIRVESHGCVKKINAAYLYIIIYKYLFMKKYQISLLICVFIFSCQKDVIYKNKYTLKFGNDSINIKLGSSSTNRSNCIQFLSSNDTDYLAVLTNKNKSIELYNLNKKKLQFVIDFQE